MLKKQELQKLIDKYERRRVENKKLSKSVTENSQYYIDTATTLASVIRDLENLRDEL